VASIQSKLFHLLLRVIGKKGYLRKQLASGKAAFFDCPEPTMAVKKICHIKKFSVNDRNVFTLTSKSKPNTGRHILYLHGGAYVQCFNPLHWKFLAGLVATTGCNVTAPDYPFAPAFTSDISFSMVAALYRQMINSIGSANLIVMGDSSGGGFALALAQKLKEENIDQPNRIILLSPWLDITLTNPGISSIEAVDPFLDKQSLQQAGKLYAGNMQLSHYLLSPVNGSLEKLGKISIFTGTNEILAADARKLKSLAQSRGIDIDYYEFEDMFHGWMFLNFPESRKARQQIIDLIQHPA
jgi:epsilon-lactone hydrolase